MTTVESNILIAEFMVIMDDYWRKDDNQGEGEQLYFQPHDTKYQLMYPSEMHFDKSWNWLMPVVEKIESLGYTTSFKTAYVRINPIEGDYDECIAYLPFNKSGYLIYQKLDNKHTYLTDDIKRNIDKQEAIYLCVVEFIKWYNENK